MQSTLKINNKEYKIISSEIKYVDTTYNSKKGFSILVNIDIELNNIKGYISFFVDYFNEKKYKSIENRKYIELPTSLNSKINMIEIFDTQEFIDFIDSEVVVEFGKIANNKIEVKIIIDDEKIKVDYRGLMNIK